MSEIGHYMERVAELKRERDEAIAQRDEARERSLHWNRSYTDAVRERDRYEAALRKIAHVAKDATDPVKRHFGRLAREALAGKGDDHD